MYRRQQRIRCTLSKTEVIADLLGIVKLQSQLDLSTFQSIFPADEVELCQL